jgi:membrane fusion protein (multidrug efflux system)
MSARVSVTTSTVDDAILLPAQAVVSTADGNAVWLVQDGTAVPRPVEVADRTADQVRVVSGLAEGDQVVVEGLIRLRPGAPVRVLEEGGGGPPTAAAP